MNTIVPDERVFLDVGGVDVRHLNDDVVQCDVVDFIHLFFREEPVNGKNEISHDIELNRSFSDKHKLVVMRPRLAI